MKRSQVSVIMFFMVLSVQICFAQSASPDWSVVHTRTMEGIDSLYNFKFLSAEKKFNEVIQMAPHDPRGYFFKAMISYYRFEFMKIEADYDRFMQLSDTVIEVAENVLDNNERNSTALFYLGGIYGYRGMVKSDKDELLSAVWDGKKGYDYLCDALEIEPKNYDAQMGVGFFNYYLSYLPKAFQWIAKVIGFAPNRELGLKMLERTATKGLYAKNEARWWLSIFYQAEDKPEKGLQYLKSLCDDYPFNPYCVQEYGFLLLFQLHRVDDAIPVFQKAITMTNKEAERYIFQGYQRLGHAYRFKNQWQEAIAWYKKFLTLETSDTARINNVNYNIGLCYELSGDRTTALPYYQRSSRSSKERLKKPMTGFDIEIEKMKNHFNAGYKAKGFDAGSALLARQDMSDDERAVILMELGSTYFEEKEYTQAAMHFTQITGLTIKEKNWLVPYAHYQLGLCFLRNVQKGLAKQSFEKVLTFENYENEERIKEATEEELDKIDD